MLIKFIVVPDTNILTVNTELTIIKINVAIQLKWHNLYYPCYLVARLHVTFPVTTKSNILCRVSVPDYENWPVLILKTG